MTRTQPRMIQPDAVTYPEYNPQQNNSLNAPPRLLLIGVIGLLLLIVVAALGLVMYINGGRRLGSLLPLAVIVAAVAPLFIIGAAVALRRSLPRWVVPALVVLMLVVYAGGAIGGVAFYRSSLPPRYQEELTTPFPFLRAFMAPTPVGGMVPTVAVTPGGLSAEQLLSMPLNTSRNTPGVAGDAEPAALLAANTDEAEAAATAEATATFTPSPSATPTPEATVAPTQAAALPTDAPTLAPTLAPTTALAEQAQVVSAGSSAPAFQRPVSAFIYGITPVRQGWNNCGPANITQALSFYSWNEDQEYAADLLKPESEDKNVSPVELVNFVNDQSLVRALYRVGGNMEMLKQLIAANFPVIIETTLEQEGEDWMGHYQTLVGYDDTARSFYVYDTWLGTGSDGGGLVEEYADFDNDWTAFNRVFIVVYREEDEDRLSAILGEHIDPVRAAEIALETAEAEARANPQDPFPWFNLGSSYVRIGQNEAAQGDEAAALAAYTRAATFYDQSRQQELPFRMNWYQFGMFEAYYEVGRYDEVLSIVRSTLNTGGQYVEEVYYWQGRALEAQGNTGEAASAYSRALAHNPRYVAAQQALNALNA